MRRLARAAMGLLLALTAAPAAQAGVSQADLITAGMPASLAPFAARVSASEGNWDSVNPFGCAGAFQFCPDTRRRYYSGTVEQFLASPSAQVTAYRAYMANEWRIATGNGFESLIGRQVCHGGQCATITASSILMGCQFGCGSRGKLGHYFRTGNCDDRQARDGNGLSVCAYLIRGAGYDVSAITGAPEATPAPPAGRGLCFERDLLSMAGMVVVNSADRPITLAFFSIAVLTKLSLFTSTPRSTTSKPAPSSIMETRFLPMS